MVNKKAIKLINNKEYEKDFGANTVLMLQIELTRTIADRWFAEAEIGFIPRIRGKM